MAQTIEERRAKKRAYMQAFRAANPEINRQRERAWRAAHPDYYRTKATRWRAADPERSRAAARASYQRNKVSRKALRDARPDVLRKQREAWRKANLDKDAAKSRRRHARKRGAAGSHTLEQFRCLCEIGGWKCAYCSCELTAKTVTEDHVMPISRGGSDFIENIVPACVSCNSRKKAMTAVEYREYLRLIS